MKSTIGSFIKSLRTESGTTVDELATVCETSTVIIKQIENGNFVGNLTDNIIGKMSLYFNISPSIINFIIATHFDNSKSYLIGKIANVIKTASDITHGVSFGKRQDLIDIDYRNFLEQVEVLKEGYEEYKESLKQ